jgi:nitrite reductase/ring-hydroxylating ferredoxin subunit
MGLCNAIMKAGGHIFTQSKATHINHKGAMVNGFKVSAQHIIVATNTPINDLVTMHTKQWPYRTYVIAALVPKGVYPYSLWWDTGNQHSKWVAAPYHYVRMAEYDLDLLISGGEDHRTGQADDEHIAEENRYHKLVAWTKSRFPEMKEMLYQWSGQVMEPVDSLAYIGKNPGDDNVYIITGDSGNGMTHATLGGIIITDIIMGRDNVWEALYSPSRITLSSTVDYLQEVGNMVAQFGDWFSNGDIHQLDELKPGQGAIISSGLKKAAAYRDLNNEVHLCSAVCPHLGGILQWNADEQSFDCPLHGSRFTATGEVINGPASCDLKKIKNEFDQ